MIKKRDRFYVAVEGQSEQSFIKWIQELADQKGLNIHLDCYPLAGGGYSSMLERTLNYRRRGKLRGSYKECFMLVDSDRSSSGQDWPLEQLKSKTRLEGLTLCPQTPTLEALLLRMFPGKERAVAHDASAAMTQLLRIWPEYQKPVDASTLSRKYSLDDLRRVAVLIPDLDAFLRRIGLIE